MHKHFHEKKKKNIYKIERKFCALHPKQIRKRISHTHKRRTYVILVHCLRLCFFLFSIYLSSLALRSVVFLFLRILLIHFDFFFSFFFFLSVLVGSFAFSAAVDFFHFRGFGISHFRSFFFFSFLLLLRHIIILILRSFLCASCHHTECVRARMDTRLSYVLVSWMHCIYYALFNIHKYICIDTKYNISRRISERKSKTM